VRRKKWFEKSRVISSPTACNHKEQTSRFPRLSGHGPTTVGG
jgi:hypothetical protein